MVDVIMESQSYTVMENVGDEDLGLMVCATVAEADFEFTVFLIPEDESALGQFEYFTARNRG